MSVITAAFFYLRPLLTDSPKYFDRILGFFGLTTNRIIINWKVSKTAQMEVNNSSKRFEAILHQVRKLKYGEAAKWLRRYCSMSNLEDTKVQHRWTDVRSDLAELLPEN